jgi:hypothetical protein
MRKNLIKCQKDNHSKKTRHEGLSLSKWKLWNRPKGKEAMQTEVEPTQDITTKPVQQTQDRSSEQNEAPIMEYNETLYSRNSSVKPEKKPGVETKEPLKRTSWESPRTIEQNIDTMKKTQPETLAPCSQDSDNIEKKVDQLLLKKKLKL